MRREPRRAGPCAQHSAHVHFTDGVNESWMTWTEFVQPREYRRCQTIFAPICHCLVDRATVCGPCRVKLSGQQQACAEIKEETKQNKKNSQRKGTKMAAAAAGVSHVGLLYLHGQCGSKGVESPVATHPACSSTLSAGKSTREHCVAIEDSPVVLWQSLG